MLQLKHFGMLENYYFDSTRKKRREINGDNNNELAFYWKRENMQKKNWMKEKNDLWKATNINNHTLNWLNWRFPKLEWHFRLESNRYSNKIVADLFKRKIKVNEQEEFKFLINPKKKTLLTSKSLFAASLRSTWIKSWETI